MFSGRLRVVTNTLSLDDENKLYTFGSNSGGQLGHGDMHYRTTPERVYVLGHIPIISVAAGHTHSVVIDSQGHVYTFGSNDFGKLGHGDFTKRTWCSSLSHNRVQIPRNQRPNTGTIPTKIMSLAKSETRCVHAACADNHTLVLSDHGQVFGFGLNRSGEIGQGKSNDVHMYTKPTKIKLSGSALDIVTGRNHSLVTSTEAFTVSDKICLNNSEEMFKQDIRRCMFQKYYKEPRIIQMDAGHTHSALLDDQGYVYTFGTWYQLVSNYIIQHQHSNTTLEHRLECLVSSDMVKGMQSQGCDKN